VFPQVTSTDPSACLAILPVSTLIVLPAMVVVTERFILLSSEFCSLMRFFDEIHY
jgi:hypothetical protein